MTKQISNSATAPVVLILAALALAFLGGPLGVAVAYVIGFIGVVLLGVRLVGLLFASEE